MEYLEIIHIIQLKKLLESSLTVCVSGLPRGPLAKRKNVFERKKAAKRNVTNRPIARDVGQVLKDDFEFDVLIIAYIVS